MSAQWQNAFLCARAERIHIVPFLLCVQIMCNASHETCMYALCPNLYGSTMAIKYYNRYVAYSKKYVQQYIGSLVLCTSLYTRVYMLQLIDHNYCTYAFELQVMVMRVCACQ